MKTRLCHEPNGTGLNYHVDGWVNNGWKHMESFKTREGATTFRENLIAHPPCLGTDSARGEQ